MLLGTRGWFAAAILLACSQAAAGATNVTIQYNLISLGGNNYEYVYTVSNASNSTTTVQLFDIDFDTSLYAPGSLQIVTSGPLNAQWSQQLLNPLPGLPKLYDVHVVSLSGGIPPGNTVAGFAVQFTWIGAGTPGSQPFQIYDPTTFALLQNGATFTPFSVPSASTASLMLLGVGLAFASAYQNRARQPHVIC